MKNHKNYNLCILLQKNLPLGSQLLKFYVKKKKCSPKENVHICCFFFFFFNKDRDAYKELSKDFWK